MEVLSYHVIMTTSLISFITQLFKITSIMVCPLMTVSAFGLFLVSDFNLEPLPAAIITSFNYLNLISII